MTMVGFGLVVVDITVIIVGSWIIGVRTDNWSLAEREGELYV